MGIRNRVGLAVRGRDFYDREEWQAFIWESLENDNNLALLAPRRVGKTSLMKKIADDSAGRGYSAVFVSVQGTIDEDGIINEILKQIEDHPDGGLAIERLGNVFTSFVRRFRKVNLGPVGIEIKDAEDDWRTVGSRLIRELSRLPGKWLLLIDELPIFVLSLMRNDPTGERARNFLNWFRDVRLGPSSERVRWVLAGSVGLDTVVRRHKMSDTINDLNLITSFGPFEEAVAHSFLKELATGADLTLSDASRQRIIERTEWLIPYHLQLIFSKIVEGRASGPVMPQSVDEACEALLRPEHRNYFDWWLQRLEEEVGLIDAQHADAMLLVASADIGGVTRESLRGALRQRLPNAEGFEATFNFLVDLLVSDGYLVLDGDRYRFRSPLVREYWRRTRA